jgi:hypothetical protein
MEGGLTDRPVLNKKITDFFKFLFGSATEKVKEVSPPDGFSTIAFLIILGVGIGLMVWYYKKLKLLETPNNIRRITSESAEAANDYVWLTTKRKDLPTYLEQLKKEGIPASHMALTNFYISTVNGAGLFYPAENGVISPDAARLAAIAGVRGYVFDIWPDLTPGGQFGPTVQVVEQGTLWRRITLNAMSFASILGAITNTVFRGGFGPGMESKPHDLVVLYLRFRGTPRYTTYSGVAQALNGAIEQYRLDTSFNACRGQDRLFRIPISQLYQRVIVMSNTKASGTPLADYINVGPQQGIRMDWVPREVSALTDTMRGEQKVKIQQNMTVCAMPLEDPATESNPWEWKEAHGLGIHMAAMNIWKKGAALDSYMAPDMFGTFSYKMKPENLRYIIEVIPKAKVPENPGWGEGDNAGKLRPVETIKTTI